MSTKRALIVEDDPFFAQILQRVIRGAGLDSDVAADVGSARTLLSARRYDAYILDMKLPDGDEEGVITLVRSVDRHAAGRTAVVTAYPMIARAVAAGFPVIDKASMEGFKQFVDSLKEAES